STEKLWGSHFSQLIKKFHPHLRNVGSYIQYRENNISPQVVFEIRSHNDSHTKMNKKLSFYQPYGVEEYYLYDPQRNELEGWQKIEINLEVIEPMEGWISPRLGVRFELGEDGLEIYRPNGEKFLSYLKTFS
ncbi:Uma2 family endonuclease, partial [Microcoleus sp. S13_C5]|uniref:Uma2 family endonuclease n=1 Tax=Microcoleus sp. S13_C5 TaxID=3055411 RepID=UPI002FD0DB98